MTPRTLVARIDDALVGLLRQRRSGQARQNTRTQRARHLWACGGWEGSHFLLSAPSAALL